MKKTHSKLKVLLGVLTLSAFIFGFTGCQNGTGDNDKKNVTPISSENGLFTAVGTSEGLKITVSDKVDFLKDSGCVITVEGNPFYISISNQDIDNNRREWVFPFTKAGTEYNIILKGNICLDGSKKYSWIEEPLQKCKALGGTDYSKIIDTDKITNSTIDVTFSPKATSDTMDSNFVAKYNIDIKSIEDLIKDKNELKLAQTTFIILLGKLNYAKSKWFTSYTVNFLDKDINELLEYSQGYIPFGPNLPKEAEWSEYDYEYCCYVVPTFQFKKFDDTIFSITNIWSTQKKYTPKDESDVVIFDPATADVSVGEIVEVDGTKYWKVTVDGYGTWINIPEVDLNGKTTFKTTMFGEKEDDANHLTLKLADNDFGEISSPNMSPIITTPKEYTAGHSVQETWNTISKTDIVSIIQPMAIDNIKYEGVNGIVVYIGKITASNNNSLNNNSFKVTYNADAQYSAAVFTVEEDWKSLEVIFADGTNFNDIQFNVLCDTVLEETAWGTAYYTTYPQIFQVNNTLVLEDCLNDLKELSKNPETKTTKIQIQNKTKNGFSIDVISAKVTKTDGTVVYVKPAGDWGSSVQ